MTLLLQFHIAFYAVLPLGWIRSSVPTALTLYFTQFFLTKCIFFYSEPFGFPMQTIQIHSYFRVKKWVCLNWIAFHSDRVSWMKCMCLVNTWDFKTRKQCQLKLQFLQSQFLREADCIATCKHNRNGAGCKLAGKFN